MKNNIISDISPTSLYLAKFLFSSYGPKCFWPIKLKDSLKCNISRKMRSVVMKCILGMQINIEIFYRLILSFWVCIARHSHSIQNKKFAYICNIFRKTREVKLNFSMDIRYFTSSFRHAFMLQ